MLPQGFTTEAPQDQVIILVVPGVPDGNILEQTTVCTNDVLHLGLNFPPVKENATRLTIFSPSKAAWENHHQCLSSIILIFSIFLNYLNRLFKNYIFVI